MNKPCHFLQCNKYYRGREKGWVKAPVLARWWQLTERTATVQSHLSAFFAPWNCWRLGKEMRGDSLLDPVWAGSAKQSEITGWKKWSLLIETRKSENWGLKKKDLEETSACSPSGLGVGEWGRRGRRVRVSTQAVTKLVERKAGLIWCRLFPSGSEKQKHYNVLFVQKVWVEKGKLHVWD